VLAGVRQQGVGARRAGWAPFEDLELPLVFAHDQDAVAVRAFADEHSEFGRARRWAVGPLGRARRAA